MDALKDEVESLEAILMEDVRITRNAENSVEIIETTVFPVVGEDESEQYVCVTLQVLPTPGYPEHSPEFKLVRPRGLDDTRLEAIRAACLAKLQELLGFPVVFDLVEVIREHLTGSNCPAGQCVICLYGFSDGDEFTRTECFHYLHSYCLARHLTATRKAHREEFEKLPAWQQKDAPPFKNICPVCREIIKDESDSLKCAMPPAELVNAPDFRLTRELRELQQRMASLFLQQKSRGGIIDLDAETGGSVISIETEEELTRRSQRRHQYDNDTNNAVCNDTFVTEAAGNSEATEPASGSGERNGTPHCQPSGAVANIPTFAPVVEKSQRLTNDPTNNNYHRQQSYNRRRGGRRHQHQHHHHRERERDRERPEQHSHHAFAAAAASGGGGSVPAAAAGKQANAQAPGVSHCR